MFETSILEQISYYYQSRRKFAKLQIRDIQNLMDVLEIKIKRYRENKFGFDYSIFEKTTRYYYEEKGRTLSKKEALEIALNKAEHKQAWYRGERKSVEEKMKFYQEVNIYPFRQPYNKRFGGFRWYRNLIKHIKSPSVLEYGCGSAVLTEYLIKRFPNLSYTVADIPSVTLDFVRWKKEKYNYKLKILTIGIGKEGIPLKEKYDLIICQDVLEHTPNPIDITISFCEHLSPGGVLVIDFLNAPGGENLQEAIEQREEVKKILKNKLISLKAIDESGGNDGLYVKSFN